MQRTLATLALLVGFGMPLHAGELAALKAERIDVGSLHGVVFYTNESDGYRIVTTLADARTGLPVHFETTLGEAQKMAISVPGKLGEKAHSFEISRAGGKLIVPNLEA